MRTFVLTVFLFVVLSPSQARCELREFTAEYRYTLGDRDSRLEARRICFTEAKRMLLEQAGSYMQSHTTISDFELTRDEIHSFAAAVLQEAEILEEKYFLEGSSTVIYIRLRGKVDIDDMHRRLNFFLSNYSAGQTPSPQPATQQAFPIPENTATPHNPQTVLPRTDTLEHAAENELLQEREHSPPRARPSQMQQEALSTVKKGMSMDEVESLLGPAGGFMQSGGYTCTSYGQTWVVFRHGVTRCVRSHIAYSSRYRGECHCAGLASDFAVR